jgi:hypothetical protein
MNWVGPLSARRRCCRAGRRRDRQRNPLEKAQLYPLRGELCQQAHRLPPPPPPATATTTTTPVASSHRRGSSSRSHRAGAPSLVRIDLTQPSPSDELCRPGGAYTVFERNIAALAGAPRRLRSACVRGSISAPPQGRRRGSHGTPPLTDTGWSRRMVTQAAAAAAAAAQRGVPAGRAPLNRQACSTDKHAQLTSTPAPFCPRGCWFRRLQRSTLSIRAKCVHSAERGPAPSISVSAPGGWRVVGRGGTLAIASMSCALVCAWNKQETWAPPGSPYCTIDS